jgi:hypothetical protein
MPPPKVVLLRGLVLGCILLAAVLLVLSWGQTNGALEHYYGDTVSLLLGLSMALGQFADLLNPSGIREMAKMTKFGPITLSTQKGGPTLGDQHSTKILLGMSLFLVVLGATTLVYDLLKYHNPR